jgi:hypothetical protein
MKEIFLVCCWWERERARESIDKISQENTHTHTHTHTKKEESMCCCVCTHAIPGIVDKFAIAAALP